VAALFGIYYIYFKGTPAETDEKTNEDAGPRTTEKKDKDLTNAKGKDALPADTENHDKFQTDTEGKDKVLADRETKDKVPADKEAKDKVPGDKGLFLEVEALHVDPMPGLCVRGNDKPIKPLLGIDSLRILEGASTSSSASVPSNNDNALSVPFLPPVTAMAAVPTPALPDATNDLNQDMGAKKVVVHPALVPDAALEIVPPTDIEVPEANRTAKNMDTAQNNDLAKIFTQELKSEFGVKVATENSASSTSVATNDKSLPEPVVKMPEHTKIIEQKCGTPPHSSPHMRQGQMTGLEDRVQILYTNAANAATSVEQPEAGCNEMNSQRMRRNNSKSPVRKSDNTNDGTQAVKIRSPGKGRRGKGRGKGGRGKGRGKIGRGKGGRGKGRGAGKGRGRGKGWQRQGRSSG